MLAITPSRLYARATTSFWTSMTSSAVSGRSDSVVTAVSLRLEDEYEDRSCDGGCRQQPAQGMEHADRRQRLAPAHRLIDGDPAASRGDEEPAPSKD